ncbi:MAG: type II toxin-antitoxin system prevent-host-death family antitoxin [Thermoleophilia bacterium]|nr:type II toxin-antitoxin system prevent-host-death family antitoxin [Thermoleophilia bacterium]
MARELTQRELRNQSGEIMRALDRGEEFIVTSNGRPVGELRPIGRRQFVPRETIAKVFAAAPAIDYEQFRADIDAFVDHDPTPRFWRDG